MKQQKLIDVVTRLKELLSLYPDAKLYVKESTGNTRNFDVASRYSTDKGIHISIELS